MKPTYLHLTILISLLTITSGHLSAQAPTWDWVNVSYGGISPYGGKFYVDQDSSIYTSMSVHHEWHADSFSIYQQPKDPYDADLVVWKLNNTGKTEWLKKYGTNWMDRNGDIRRDENDSLYVACKIDRFASTLPLDTLTGGDYRFYIDEKGNWLRAKKAPRKVSQRDAKGRTLEIGRLGTGDSLIFGRDTIYGNPIGTIPIYPDHYIAMIDSATGNYWAKHIGDFSSQRPLHLRFLDENKILLVGVTQQRATMQSCNPTFNDGIFWVLFDSLGNCISYHSIDALESTVGRIAINNQKEIYLLGHYFTSLSFGGKTWNSGIIHGSNFCVIKIDSTGSIVWANSTEGNMHSISATSMVQDLNGNIIVAGAIMGQAKIEQEIIGKDSAQDIFICSFDPNDGKLQWTKSSDTQKSQAPPGAFFQWGYIHHLAISPLNHLYVLGSFNTSTYTLGSHTLQYQGNQNIYIASLNLNKTKSISQNFTDSCPISLHFRSPTHSLLIHDACPGQPVNQFSLYTLSGLEISISQIEKRADGYSLQPGQSLPIGMYILRWERRNGARGVTKFLVGE